MTKILHIEGANEFHGAPKSWTPEQGICNTLPTRTIIDNSISWRVSEHAFTDAERAAIAAGGTLFVWISSPVHPVMSLGVSGVDYSKEPT
jgi:hypothetical protein